MCSSTINRNPVVCLAIVGADICCACCRAAPMNMPNSFARRMGKWSRQAGLDMQDIIGLTYNPLLKHYKLAADVDVNYMIHCQRGA